MKVCIDDMLVKSKATEHHITNLNETFITLCHFRMKLNPSKCTFGVIFDMILEFMVLQHRIEVNPDKILALQVMIPPRTIKKV